MEQDKERLRGFAESVAAFFQQEVIPFCGEWDRQGFVPDEIIRRMAEEGFLGAAISKEWGGRGMSQVETAILHEEAGKADSSLRSLLTVHHSLVAETLQRWGTQAQKEKYLPRLAAGQMIAAFGLSEPLTGSDAASVQTTYTETSGGFALDGEKKWITFGQRADLFLIIARNEKGVSAFLVEKNTPGLEVKPLEGIISTRASQLASLHLASCEVPAENLLGKKGMGFMQIANTALDNGRFSVAFGSLGAHLACVEAAGKYARNRVQHGQALKNHQLIRRMIADMTTEAAASKLMCYHAAKLRDRRSPDALLRTTAAKYFASNAAFRAADAAVQIFGASGLHDALPVQRYWRDLRAMRIIEGSDEMQQLMIGEEAAVNPRKFYEGMEFY